MGKEGGLDIKQWTLNPFCYLIAALWMRQIIVAGRGPQGWWMLICEGAYKEEAIHWLPPRWIKASFSSDMVPVAPSLIPGMLALGIALSTSSCHQHPVSVWHELKKSANTFHFQALNGTDTVIHLLTEPPHNADCKEKKTEFIFCSLGNTRTEGPEITWRI